MIRQNTYISYESRIILRIDKRICSQGLLGEGFTEQSESSEESQSCVLYGRHPQTRLEPKLDINLTPSILGFETKHSFSNYTLDGFTQNVTIGGALALQISIGCGEYCIYYSGNNLGIKLV